MKNIACDNVNLTVICSKVFLLYFFFLYGNEESPSEFLLSGTFVLWS